MARKIIVCMDGTGNDVGDRQTNILRLYRCLVTDSDTQRAIYVPGVGTNDSQSLMGRNWQRFKGVLGLAFGLGLEDNVMNAYRKICLTHEDGDEILLFGFSRGAYAVRVLAGFINDFGLLGAHELHLAPQVFRAYRQITDADDDDPDSEVYQRLREYEEVLEVRHVPVRFLGLYDTVSSMIRFRRLWHNFRTTGSFLEFGTHSSVNRNPSVEMVRHALAIDERRSMFRAQPWSPVRYYGNRFKSGDGKPQDVKQMWFPGYHSDIGGSPLEHRAGIGKITLLWMLGELEKAGVPLEFVGERVDDYVHGADPEKRTPGGLRYSDPDPLAPIHNSMIWKWWIFEVIPKSLTRREWKPWRRGIIWYLPFVEPRLIPDDHLISDAATARKADPDTDYDPVNLRGR
ncbi:DUF2235 domain-containing protein [uncultured Litoreibacter sp.]|uniref:DUF2235 domain-containing protein n=1 Tax=uncultured Litoreibacter sp. TaxID=1392394 RepID=UPI0026156075|nr:DUF2235 domain-containing protein [uncultured Litoreibacter sp.]